jgi:hypothetical protein
VRLRLEFPEGAEDLTVIRDDLDLMVHQKNRDLHIDTMERGRIFSSHCSQRVPQLSLIGKCRWWSRLVRIDP